MTESTKGAIPIREKVGARPHMDLAWPKLLRDEGVMDLLSPVIGLVGGLFGAWLGSATAHLYQRHQGKINGTLELFQRFNSPELLESRIRADRILKENAQSSSPRSMGQLYDSLPAEQWEHVSRVRHFFSELGYLTDIKYLDAKLAETFFAAITRYWFGKYFNQLEKNPDPRSVLWANSKDQLKAWLGRGERGIEADTCIDGQRSAGGVVSQ